MKRIATIFLLLIFIFNLVGYKVIIAYAEFKQDVSMEAKIDADAISDENLISVKTPLHLPYYNYPENFERAYGTIEIEGVEYNYVKRRVVNGALELLCIPNLAKKSVSDIGKKIAELSTETPFSGKEKKSSVYKFTFSDLFENASYTSEHKNLSYSKTFGLYLQPNSSQVFLNVEAPPPDFVAA